MPAHKPIVPVPALGCEIEIAGTVYRVHCDCKESRDSFEIAIRRRAIEIVDENLRDGVVSREQHASDRAETLRDIRTLRYAYGTQAFADMLASDWGIKQSLFARLKLNHPKIQYADVESWVDAHGWGEANRVMAEADGYAPKSNTPEVGRASPETSSGSSAA